MSSGNTPDVSVIIPVYNQELFLSQCLDSVLGQTLKKIEIICIDDGSTDQTSKFLSEYRLKDNRLKILKQVNKGAGAARNYGLREAKGKYLSFLDSDDFFEPDMLEKAFKQAEKDQADFVVFNSDQYLEDEKRFATFLWGLRKPDIPPYTPFTYRQLTDNIFKSFMGWAWDKLYLHSFIKENNLWFQEQRTTNDLLFVFSALVAAKRISIVEQVLAHQRIQNQNSLSNTREKSWYCFYDALTALREYLKKQGIFWELERDFINYALHFSLWNLNTLAEPSHSALKKKLQMEWLTKLDITRKNSNYYYNRHEYELFIKLFRNTKKESFNNESI